MHGTCQDFDSLVIFSLTNRAGHTIMDVEMIFKTRLQEVSYDVEYCK